MKFNIILAFTLLLLSRVYAQHGLDPTFGSNGAVVTTNISPNGAGTWDKVHVLPGNKILALGSPYNQLKLVRYKFDGTIDSTFAKNGIFSYPLLASCSTIIHDSTILIGGALSNNNFFILKLKENGIIDSSFGTNGFTSQLGGDNGATGIAVQSDGKIILSGSSGDNFAMVRFLSNGVPDSSFGSYGRIMTFGGYNLTRCNSIALQSDGRILLAGSGGITSFANFLVIRYLTDGSVDSTFGVNGRFIWQPGDGAVHDIALCSDGRILLSGGAFSTAYPQGADIVMRLTANGNIDSTFNQVGFTAMTYPGYNPNGYLSHCNMKTLPDGRIQLAGTVEDTVYPNWKYSSLWRCLANGEIDRNFCINGSLVLTVGQLGSGINDFDLQSDGKMVTAGFSNYGNGGLIPHFTLARFEPNGNVSIPKTIKHQISADIYPNPANAYFSIEATQPISSVRLADANGKTYKIINKPASNTQFITQDLPNGIYYVFITTSGYAPLTKTVTILH